MVNRAKGDKKSNARRKGRAPEKKYDVLLRIAEDRRKLEIELLWQRALLFSGFAILGFSAFAYCIDHWAEFGRAAALPVATFGIITAWIWTLVNRGSKFWQEYWENQIDKVKSRAKEYRFFDTAERYRTGSLFTAKLGIETFARALTRYNKSNDSSINVKLSERDIESLKTQSKFVLKTTINREYRIVNQEGTLEIFQNRENYWARRFSPSKLIIVMSDFVLVAWFAIWTIALASFLKECVDKFDLMEMTMVGWTSLAIIFVIPAAWMIWSAVHGKDNPRADVGKRSVQKEK